MGRHSNVTVRKMTELEKDAHARRVAEKHARARKLGLDARFQKDVYLPMTADQRRYLREAEMADALSTRDKRRVRETFVLAERSKVKARAAAQAKADRAMTSRSFL